MRRKLRCMRAPWGWGEITQIYWQLDMSASQPWPDCVVNLNAIRRQFHCIHVMISFCLKIIIVQQWWWICQHWQLLRRWQRGWFTSTATVGIDVFLPVGMLLLACEEYVAPNLNVWRQPLMLHTKWRDGSTESAWSVLSTEAGQMNGRNTQYMRNPYSEICSWRKLE